VRNHRFGPVLAFAARPRARLVFALALAAFPLAGCESVEEFKGEPSQAMDDEARRKHYEEAAQTYYEGGKYAQSAAQWRKVLELTPQDQKAKWGLAKSLANQGTPPMLREAQAIYAEIVDLDWSHPTLGDRRFEVEKDYAQVFLDLADWYEKDLRVLEQKLDASKDAAEMEQVRKDIARETAERNKLLSEAMPRFERVLAMSPENPFALAGLAKSNLLVGDPGRGIAYARRYVALSVASREGWERSQKDWEVQLAQDKQKITDEQREHFRKKIRGAREKEIAMRLLIASVLMRTGGHEGAITEYDTIIKLDPTRPAAFLERAQAKAMSGRYRDAVLDLEHYLQVTDPVKQRNARVGAADLLQKYRIAAAKSASPRDGFAPIAPSGTQPSGATQPSGPPPPPPPPAPSPTPSPTR